MNEGTRQPVRAATPARQLGSALRVLQQRSGRTLRALEEQVRISDSSLSRYFRGDTVPPWSVVRDLCRALGADPTAYRSLWEAAYQGHPEPPARAEPPTAPLPAEAQAEAPVQSTPRTGEPRPRRAWPTGRWAYLIVGAVVGLAAGLLLSWALPGSSGTPSSAGGAPSEARREAPGGPGTRAGTPKPVGLARIFVNRTTGRCLDDSLEFGLRTYQCNGMSYQWWTIHAYSDGTRRLRNHATGKCLDGDGAELRTRPCGNSAAQRWTFVPGEDEAVALRNGTSERCLDDGRAELRSVPCRSSSRQKWA
ncbi:helix-turn-helix domain-containing protein [Streptomyces heilongjiangensis]|uniref:Helix-turn-helix domain-containing protein n=1 Tax=Streptomyces heilongjiangensis TaxID=945052 RepID=A0ABW1B916_9ACTN|nr:helix-turn-helix domain-containing protein [Streptomyces heilongjiangensis]MDC2947239.1 ricin-type beta-trefoil lectin domain protein [Streptomyces heilongjiangensis]